MGPPDIPAAPVDPNLATEQAQAQNDLVNSLRKQTSGDMASLMARYGTQLALAGASGSGGSSMGSPLSTGFSSAFSGPGRGS
jgi:hypothetical protein